MNLGLIFHAVQMLLLEEREYQEMPINNYTTCRLIAVHNFREKTKSF